MAITILNDRIELSSVFAVTSSIGDQNTSYTNDFTASNKSWDFTIPKEYIGNAILTDTTQNPIKVIGVNQQTGQRYTASFNSNESTVYGSNLEEGYYRIHVRQFAYPNNSLSSVTGIDDTTFYELTTKNLYWNRSFLSFMTYIQPGVYWAGSPTNEYGRDPNREVMHQVTISKAFYIERTQIPFCFCNLLMSGSSFRPVDIYGTGNEPKQVVSASVNIDTCFSSSNADFWHWYNYSINTMSPRTTIAYTKYNRTDANPSSTARYTPYSYMTIDDKKWAFPMPYITGSYMSAAEDRSLLYAMWKKLPMGEWHWDLPTEGQWEYACRASTRSAFNNGENLKFKTDAESGGTDAIDQPNINEVCWFNRHNNSIHPGAMLKPNQWGLFDCHGNIWEWCKDWSIDDNTSFNNGDDEPTVASNLQSQRALRGGGYTSRARHCRSASRNLHEPSYVGNYFRFRVALVK